MRKNLILSGLLLSSAFMVSCGGSSGIGSSGAGSFYNLSVVLEQTSIESETVKVETSNTADTGTSTGNTGNDNTVLFNITLPADTISGKVSLVYTGQSRNPLKGVIREASLCVLDSCYPVPVSGVLTPNAQPLNVSFQINSHKVGLPWIAINPFEDKIISTQMQTANLSGANTPYSTTSTYLNVSKTETLSNVPVAKNSIQIRYNGQFSNSRTYTTSNGRITLDRGTVSSNTIVPNRVQVTVGSSTCQDDGSGNITGDCTGTIDYDTGVLTIDGITTSTEVSVSYRIQGQMLCMDDGNGVIGNDCENSSIDYGTGQLTYKFKYSIPNTPATVNINYAKGSSSSNSITYNLPPKTVAGTYIYNVFGRVLEVYQDNVKLCDNQSAGGSCSITRTGDSVKITFTGTTVPSNLTLRYSQDVKVDINPAVDATLYGGSYNGQTNPTITGLLRIKVKLEDGSTLTADTPVTFRIIP